MLNSRILNSALSVVVLFAGLSWDATAVELMVEEPAGVPSSDMEWVTTGVPLPQGAVRNAKELCVVQGSRKLPSQVKNLCAWPDGSVKWALCTFPVKLEANGDAEVKLADTGNSTKGSPLSVKDGSKEIIVNTGVIEARIDKENFRILDEVKRNNNVLLKQDQSDGAILWLSPNRSINAADIQPEEMVIEEEGPCRVCVTAKGRFKGAMTKGGKEMIRWTCRLYFNAMSDQVRIHFTLGNDGAMGANRRDGREYFKFDALTLDFGLKLGNVVKVAGDEANGTVSGDKAFVLRQRGAYKKPGIFEARLGDKVLVNDQSRSSGALAIAGRQGGLLFATRDFWQNYPKELKVTPEKLSVALWPEFGGYPEGRDVYNLCGGRQKTYQMVLSFGGGGKDEAGNLAKRLNKPLMALAEPEYYADCGALGLLGPAGVKTGNEELDAKIKRYDELQRSKPAGLTEAAEKQRLGPYYNWVNYGDLNWAAGSCSLHYDWTHIMLIHWLRTGQRDFFEWGSAMARHQHDIDMPRSERDGISYRYLSAYEKETSDRGPTGWHLSTDKGRMLPITSHHWVKGQGLYAVLTGDPEAFITLRLNGAEGVRNRMRHALKEKRKYQARSYGWSIECLLAVYGFTGDESCLKDAQTLFENGLWYMFNERGKTGDMGGNVQTSYIGRPLIDYHMHTSDSRSLEMLKAITDASDKWKGKYEYMMFEDPSAYVYYRTGDESYLEKARDYLAYLLQKRGKFRYSGLAWTKEEAKTSRTGFIHIGIERLKKLGRAPAKQK